jgi:hypothetical protein
MMGCIMFTNRLSFSIILLFIFSNVFASNCRPTINSSQNNYMIGYGSLINDQSRLTTNPRAKYAYPLMLHGFKRVWGVHGGHYKTTFLTIIPSDTSSLNAIYYPVNNNDILATDAREKSYCRVAVDKNNIKVIGTPSLPTGQFWVYSNQASRIKTPNKEYPIAQSYVDLFLGGCITVGKQFQLNDFAQKCISLTHGWPAENHTSTWINDRMFPRRPFNTPHAVAIDKLLNKNFKNYHQHPFGP